LNNFQFGRAQPLHLEGDVSSALSGNSIVGRKLNGPELESKMLLFNGLYFRGNWAMPFMELRSNEEKYFNAISGKQDIKFMMTCGSFKYTEIPSKKLIAIELPYKVRTRKEKQF
jgi:serine protease inhibitor